MPASTARALSRQWIDRLAPYRRHRNDEHLEALVDEAVLYSGIHLENDLTDSDYWSKASLSRRVGVLLFLVDRGVVERGSQRGRRVFEPIENAEAWVVSQSELAPYAGPTLELIGALRRVISRRSRPSRP